MSTSEVHVVPARHGKAVKVPSGATLKIVTPVGTQVADTWAFSAADFSEHLSMDHTRSVNSNIFVDKGTRLVSNQRRLMLTVIDDTSPGRHDTLLCPCNAAIYREHGVTGYHRSCTDNLHEALRAIGAEIAFTPAAMNVFMNIPVAEDGSVSRLPPRSRPGDALFLRAEMDLVVVVSACPQDITPINGADRTPTDIHLEIVAPSSAPWHDRR
jgi:uncharacterized protein YcgI (DUF1989 family)